MENRSHMNVLVQNEKDIETIQIKKSEFKNGVFTEDEKEISYHGEMYDVKSRSADGDYIVFHCINDKKETSLLVNLNDQVNNNMDTKSSSGQKQNNISKNISKDYFFNGKPAILLSSSKFIFSSAICHLTSVNSLSLTTPPPKAV